MKKLVFLLALVFIENYSFSQSIEKSSLFNYPFIQYDVLVGIVFLTLILLVVQHFVFKNKLKMLRKNYDLKLITVEKVCEAKISSTEKELLNMVNASVSEIQKDYMNKVIQIRSDIENHKSKIIHLMEENKEMKMFYEQIISEHFNPIMENLNK